MFSFFRRKKKQETPALEEAQIQEPQQKQSPKPIK